MKDHLAEQLLVRVLGWTAEEIAAERPILQALASYKYDEYQQFAAGSRFIESLALWLNQFSATAERQAAYRFIREHLIFCSDSETRHLVELAYPDCIHSTLLRRVAESPADVFKPKRLAATKAFRVARRRTLFLGLSDGARIDAFRRANPVLNHEQIWQTYEVSDERVGKLQDKLAEHLTGILNRDPTSTERTFQTLVLLDDFSASGTSYYSPMTGAPSGGKVMSLFNKIFGEGAAGVRSLFDVDNLQVQIVLYVATEQALKHLRAGSAATWGREGVGATVDALQVIPDALKMSFGSNHPINALIDRAGYYDDEIHDEHFKKGGTRDGRYGYAACGLPLVLHHNTPNNSIALLMSYENLRFRGLFPRVQRHKDMS